ncbi:hypothetical protein [Actinoplanes sp. ATCC 53533]|uniref:hypothetical protein n=1 Tax=Actinoplanes sp. ATCC 53533 TaxID=1288362 RepID=UPI000F794873|nr:hypothetical protein [Actinoplanes sp. ATCC 53533]
MMAPAEGTREIRVVLDRSALESYTKGHVHVGEVITEVADDANVGIPATVLMEAQARALGDERARALLQLLAAAEGVVVLALGAAEAARAAGTVPLVDGDLPLAHGVWAANANAAFYLTTDPDQVKSVIPDAHVIRVPTEDA